MSEAVAQAPVQAEQAPVVTPEQQALQAAEAHAQLLGKAGELNPAQIKDMGMGDIADQLGISYADAQKLGRGGVNKLQREAEAVKAEEATKSAKHEHEAIDKEVAEHLAGVAKEQLTTLQNDYAEKIASTLKRDDLGPVAKETLLGGLKDEKARKEANILSGATLLDSGNNHKKMLTDGLANGETKAVRDEKKAEAAKKDWQARMGVNAATGGNGNTNTSTNNGNKPTTKTDFNSDNTRGNMSYSEWLNAGGQNGAQKREKDGTGTPPPANTNAANPNTANPSQGNTPNAKTGKGRKGAVSEYTKAMGAEIGRAKRAKAAGNMAEYNRALAAMGELSEANELETTKQTEERFIAGIDRDLDAAPDGRIKRVDRQSEKIKANFEVARDEFIRLSVLRRGKNFGQKDELEKSKVAYITAREAALENMSKKHKAEGKSDADINTTIDMLEKLEILQLDTLIQDAQEAKEASKILPIRKFNEFWARNTGRKPNGKRNLWGMAKKGVVMGGVSAVTGAAIAFAMPVVLGGLVGSAAGSGVAAGLASSVSRSIMRSKLNANVGSKTGAQFYGEDLLNKYADKKNASQDSTLSSKELSDLVQGQTDHLVGRNRRRTAGAVAIGGLAGFVGAYGARHAFNAIKHANNHKPSGNGTPKFYGNGSNPNGVAGSPGTSVVNPNIGQSNDIISQAIADKNLSTVNPNVDPVRVGLASAAKNLNALPAANIVPNTGDHIIKVITGGGPQEQLGKGLNLKPSEWARATDILDKAGYLNGDKINGIGHDKAGKLVAYIRGAGDGNFYIPKSAIDELRQNGITVA